MDYTKWSLPDAVQFLVAVLRNSNVNASQGLHYNNYGFDLYVDGLAKALWEAQLRGSNQFGYGGPDQQQLRAQTSVVFDAAWFLVQRGVLRIGVQFEGRQYEDGLGLSLTPFGHDWIKTATEDDFMIADGGAMQQRFGAHAKKLGAGYFQRATEAVVCYQAHAYLACCAMCGAGAESILLALASEKTGDPAKTLRDYSTASGRTITLNKIVGQADANTKRIFEAFVGLLSYWRDETAHGKHSHIGPDEAAISLIELLRFAMIADRRWAELTHR
jgi:hypothetical protein